MHLSHCFSSPLLRAPSRRPRACPARVDGFAAPAAPPVAQRQVKSSRRTFRRQQLQIISRDMWLYLGCNAPRRSNVTASESVVNQTSIQPPPQHGEDGAHICSLSKRNKIAVYTLIIVAFLIIAHVLLFLTTSCATAVVVTVLPCLCTAVVGVCRCRHPRPRNNPRHQRPRNNPRHQGPLVSFVSSATQPSRALPTSKSATILTRRMCTCSRCRLTARLWYVSDDGVDTVVVCPCLVWHSSYKRIHLIAI